MPSSRRREAIVNYERSYLHSRDVTHTVCCQGPYDESVRYGDFMGLGHALAFCQSCAAPGRPPTRPVLLGVLPQSGKAFETYWTSRHGVGAMDKSYSGWT